MRLLLDTHAFLWWVSAAPELPSLACLRIADEGNDVFVSAASAWEISTKERLGKLPAFSGISVAFFRLLTEHNFRQLNVTPAHALQAGAYEVAHRDPFDRMLAAQAQMENMLLVSGDAAFRNFPVTLLWQDTGPSQNR